MRRNNISRWPLCTLERRSGPRVGLDLDGVLRDIDRQIHRTITTMYPKAKLKYPEKWGLVKKYINVPENIDDIVFLKHHKEVFEDAKFYIGAEKFVYDLFKLVKEYDAQLVLVTKQHEVARHSTYRWIADNKIPADILYVVRMENSKIDARVDILIDDSIGNLEEQNSLLGGAICKARPWNIEYVGNRYEGYGEILDETRKILRNIEKCNERFSKLSKAEQRREIYLGLSRIRNGRKRITDANLRKN